MPHKDEGPDRMLWGICLFLMLKLRSSDQEKPYYTSANTPFCEPKTKGQRPKSEEPHPAPSEVKGGEGLFWGLHAMRDAQYEFV